MRLSYRRISAPLRGENRDLAECSPACTRSKEEVTRVHGEAAPSESREGVSEGNGLRGQLDLGLPAPGPVRNQSAVSSTPSQCSVMAARAPKTLPQVCFTDFLCFLLTLLTCGGIWIRRLPISDSVQKGRQYIGKYSPYESTTSTFIIKDMITKSG